MAEQRTVTGSSPTREKTSGKELIDTLLAAFMQKDLATVVSLFADDAVFYDPHYPQPHMKGIATIEQGIAWGLQTLEKPGFKLRKLWVDNDSLEHGPLDHGSGVAELDTFHIIKGGMKSNFDQVFVFEFRDHKFTRLQSYVPYRPGGIGGMIGKMTGVVWRLQGKIK